MLSDLKSTLNNGTKFYGCWRGTCSSAPTFSHLCLSSGFVMSIPEEDQRWLKRIQEIQIQSQQESNFILFDITDTKNNMYTLQKNSTFI